MVVFFVQSLLILDMDPVIDQDTPGLPPRLHRSRVHPSMIHPTIHQISISARRDNNYATMPHLSRFPVLHLLRFTSLSLFIPALVSSGGVGS